MKQTNFLVSVLLFSLCFSTKGIADGLSSLQESYHQKKYQQTIKAGIDELSNHPDDVDVRLYVALSYYQEKQFDLAENHFILILNKNPDYKDALTGLVRTYLAEKKYVEAQKTIKKGLMYYPEDQELRSKRITVNLLIDAKIELKTTKVQHAKKRPKQEFKVPITTIPKQSIRDRSHFELMGYTSNADVNNPAGIWDWSTLSLYRKNEYGAFGGGVNYANRRAMGAPQVFVNAQPNLNENIWLDLTYAQANNPNLFPDNTVIGEAYVFVGKTVEVSAGDGYRKIQNTYFNTYTASIGKYLGNYYFSFRPNYYIPKSGPRSLLFTMKARRYAQDNPDKYIGLVFATGTSPDLFDLITVAFFKVKNNILLLEGQQPISDNLLFLYGGGYETQQFPNNFIRRLAYGNIGLKLRFGS